jgi:hypothetical protein
MKIVNVVGVLGAVSLLTLVGTGNAAAAPLSVVTLEGSYDSTALEGDFGTEEDSYTGISASARWSLPIGERFSVQLDLNHTGNDVDNSDENNYGGWLSYAAHFSARSDAWLFGAFVGAGEIDLGSNGDAELTFAGLEGQFYLGNHTLYFQGGSVDDGEDIALTSGDFARAAWRLFLTKDTRTMLQWATTRGTLDGSDAEGTVFGLEIEHKPPSWPVSLFASYERGDYEQPDEGDTAEETVWRVGVRVNFGATTLQENDRRGATLDTHFIGHMVGQLGGPIE